MKINILISFIFVLLLTSCDKHEEVDIAVDNIKPEKTGTWVDTRDNITYHWVRYSGLDWITENLHYTNPDSQSYTTEFGNKMLYEFGAAIDAVPEGWRLPTDEDFKKLEKTLGMSDAEVDQEDWRGAGIGTILQQDSTGSGLHFDLSGYGWNLGGTGNYNLNIYGVYWTSTTIPTIGNVAWVRRISTFNNKVERFYSTTADRYYSIRLVRDVK